MVVVVADKVKVNIEKMVTFSEQKNTRITN